MHSDIRLISETYQYHIKEGALAIAANQAANVPEDQTEDEKTPVRPELEALAKKYLGVPTLQARMSDSLDFHDISVWGLRKALEEAYKLGQQSKYRL